MSTSLQTTTSPQGASSFHTTIRAHKQPLSANAAFYRGGTSKGVIFEDSDLPTSDKDREHLFRSCIGSPDPYGRQLDGMGGGVSSVSKVCIVKQSDNHGADVDFTFVQVSPHHDHTRS
jgi:2-methylaconitate cis-trans-isomerase PrpF